MTSLRRGVRLGLAVLGAGTMFAAAPGSAQTATTGAFTERPNEALSRNLRSLATNPKSATALMGAGKAALDLGDPQAALTFFARAEEQMPRDGRIKMWIGSALIQLQQPHAALKFFRDATDLGVPEADVARDRGLAFDIVGKPRDAQRDYRLVLQRGRDAEVTRRLALSLAISGERESALRLLEDQLLVRDRAAERSRAMILALTGDTEGAARAARDAMPGPQAHAMTPFLARLPSLSPADRALAVHLGIFPGDGRTAAPPASYAANDFAAAVTDAGRPDPGQGSLARRVPLAEPVSTAPRRRPGAEEMAAAVTPPRAAAARPAANREAAGRPAGRSAANRPAARPGFGGGNPAWAWSRGLEPARPRREAQAKPKPATPVAARAEAPPETRVAATLPPAPAAGSEPATPPPAEPPAAAAPEPQPVPVEPVPVEPAAAGPSAPPPETETAPGGSRLADLSAAIATIDEPEAAPVRAAPAKARPRIAAPASTAARGAAVQAKRARAAPAEPSRVWVQVAGGADKGALPREYARLKAKAPKVLGARTAWSAPLNATNRLLVGPFASHREAQAFVNQLKAQDLSGFAWTSAVGQKIEKLPAR